MVDCSTNGRLRVQRWSPAPNTWSKWDGRHGLQTSAESVGAAATSSGAISQLMHAGQMILPLQTNQNLRRVTRKLPHGTSVGPSDSEADWPDTSLIRSSRVFPSLQEASSCALFKGSSNGTRFFQSERPGRPEGRDGVWHSVPIAAVAARPIAAAARAGSPSRTVSHRGLFFLFISRAAAHASPEACLWCDL